MDAPKGTERVNEEGATEIKVETVDYRSPPGTDDQPPKKENVEVIHITGKDNEPEKGRGGVVAEAAAKAADKIQSAKEKLTAATKNDKND